MIITVWPGRVLCVWDGKGNLVGQVQLAETAAREHMRAILGGWDEKPVSPQCMDHADLLV